MDKISQVLGTTTGIEVPEVLDAPNAPEAPESTSTELVSVPHNEIPALIDKYHEMRNNLEQDYDLARSNLRKVLEQAMALLPYAISLAREAESPRVYESTSAFIKTISDINKDLIEVTERILKQDPNAGKNAPQEQATVTNNAIFVGTTEELFAKLIQASNIIENGEI